MFTINTDYSPKQHQPLGFLLKTDCVLCEVGTQFLYSF